MKQEINNCTLVCTKDKAVMKPQQLRKPVEGVPAAFRRTDRDLAPVTNGKQWAISRSRMNPEGGGAWPADPAPGIDSPFGRPGDLLPESLLPGRHEVTDVWLERLKDSAFDKTPFLQDWDEKLAGTIYTSDNNPWVWVCEFEGVADQLPIAGHRSENVNCP